METTKRLTATHAALDDCRAASVSRRWADVRASARLALELARLDGDAQAEGLALRYRGMATRELDGSDAQAMDFRRAITLLSAVGDREHRAAAQGDLAGYLLTTGSAVEALALLESAQLTFLELGLVERAQRCDHQRAWADLVTGNYQAAIERARRALPMDRAMMSLDGEGWALRTGALGATYAGDLDAALDFAEAFRMVARIGNDSADLLDSHLIYHRTMARRGVAGSVDRLLEWLPGVDALGEPVMSATARVILADARLGTVPDLDAYVAREACATALAGPWLAAEQRHLTARWNEQPIRRDGHLLVVDLTRVSSLPDEHLIHDYARLASAREATDRVIDAAERLGLSRRTYYKVVAAMEKVTGRRRRRL